MNATTRRATQPRKDLSVIEGSTPTCNNTARKEKTMCTVSGKPWSVFNKEKETITLRGLTGPVAVTAQY